VPRLDGVSDAEPAGMHSLCRHHVILPAGVYP
jgi:hypothetical protein